MILRLQERNANDASRQKMEQRLTKGIGSDWDFDMCADSSYLKGQKVIHGRHELGWL